MALAEVEMRKPGFQDFHENSAFVYFFQHYGNNLSFEANRHVLKVALNDFPKEATVEDTFHFVTTTLPLYMTEAPNAKFLCETILRNHKRYKLHETLPARLYGRLYASVVCYIARRVTQNKFEKKGLNIGYGGSILFSGLR